MVADGFTHPLSNLGGPSSSLVGAHRAGRRREHHEPRPTGLDTQGRILCVGECAPPAATRGTDRGCGRAPSPDRASLHRTLEYGSPLSTRQLARLAGRGFTGGRRPRPESSSNRFLGSRSRGPSSRGRSRTAGRRAFAHRAIVRFHGCFIGGRSSRSRSLGRRSSSNDSSTGSLERPPLARSRSPRVFVRQPIVGR